MTTDLSTASGNSTPFLVRMVAVHVAAIAVPFAIVLWLIGLSFWAVLVALVIAGGSTAWRMRDLDARLARRFGAVPVDPDAHPRLASVAESVAMAVGIPQPRLFVIDSAAGNAITWGAGDGPPSLAVTTGLLHRLDRVELEAVLAHQATMVNDRPVDVITLGAHLFGPLAGGPLAGIVASFIHTTTDPRSIVLADLEGARATRYPPGMVAALEALLDTDTLVPAVPRAFSNLCLVTPVHEPNPFALHPPLEDRIDLLREI